MIVHKKIEDCSYEERTNVLNKLIYTLYKEFNIPECMLSLIEYEEHFTDDGNTFYLDNDVWYEYDTAKQIDIIKKLDKWVKALQMPEDAFTPCTSSSVLILDEPEEK